MSNLAYLPVHYGPARPTDKRRKCVRALAARPTPNNVRCLRIPQTPPQTDKQRAYELYQSAAVGDQDERDPAWGVSVYQAAIKLDPKLAVAYTNLGNCYFRLHRQADAMAYYKQALELDPMQPEAHYNLGYIELERGNASIAIELFKQSLCLDPTFADAYFNLAMAYEQSGMHVDSLPVQATWRKYLDLTRNATGSHESTWREIAKRHVRGEVG